MKIKRLVVSFWLLLSLLCGFNSDAQFAASYIAQGRSYLAVSNILSANLSFSNAVEVSPDDPMANFFYAGTRLLVLPSLPVGSAFLTRIGVPVAGRNIYHWTAELPKDSKRVPVAPTGVNANEFTALAKTNLLVEVIGAEANLAKITDTNFTLALTAQDTAITAVTVDYGDVQLLRSMLDAMAYFIYNTYDWNLDAQLSVVRSISTNSNLTVAGFLADFPSLLTFASTNDLSSAEGSFIKGANSYLTASQIIRGRPPGTDRLFNYTPSEAGKETKFRETLSDLASSISNGPVALEANSNYSVFMPASFTGKQSLRSFLPPIYGDGFVVGTEPDDTFGGLVGGVNDDALDALLVERHLKPIPTITPVASPDVRFSIRGIAMHSYVVQSSTDLLNWVNVSGFLPLTNTFSFVDPAGHADNHRFYRVVDSNGNLPPAPNNDFANRIPLIGLGVQSSSYINNAIAEPNEPGGFPSIWWSWTAQQTGVAVFSFAGSQAYVYAVIYTGSTLTNLAGVPDVMEPDDFGSAYNGYSFNAVAGTIYQIQVFSLFNNTGSVELAIGSPNLTVSSPVDGSTLSTNQFTLSASATDVHTPIVSISYEIDFYDPDFGLTVPYQTGGNVGSSLNLTLTNLIPTYYYIYETATDALGISVYGNQLVIIQP